MPFLRSSRGMLVIGAILAVAAFVLVVMLLNQKSGNSTATNTLTTGTALPTATAASDQPTAIPTVGLSMVVALKDVPVGTKFDSDALIHAYFRDYPVQPNQIIPANTVSSIAQWETDTHVISGTTFIGALQMTTRVASSKPLLASDYRVLPIPPLASMSYAVDPGRVAEAIQLQPLYADNGFIMPGDYVDLLLSIRQHEVDSHFSNPPSSTTGGPIETQEIVSNAKVVNVALGGIYTLAMPIQDALLVKYVKDTSGVVDMVLVSAYDVKNQTSQPKTNAIVPEYFLTPQPEVRGTPGLSGSPTATPVNGVPYPFVTPLPTLTPKP